VKDQQTVETVTAQYTEELADLDRRLDEENPGVQAVIDAYALAKPAVDELENYMRIANAQPVTRTSNGSASF
jgi:hypothetical protein